MRSIGVGVSTRERAQGCLVSSPGGGLCAGVATRAERHEVVCGIYTAIAARIDVMCPEMRTGAAASNASAVAGDDLAGEASPGGLLVGAGAPAGGAAASGRVPAAVEAGL